MSEILNLTKITPSQHVYIQKNITGFKYSQHVSTYKAAPEPAHLCLVLSMKKA